MSMRHFRVGYLIVSVRGPATEKFINLASSQGISLWDIRRGPDVAFLRVEVDSFFALRPLSKKTGCRLRIEHKTGLPFLFSRLRRRRGLVFGLALFVSALYFFSSFVLFIGVEGAETLGRERILAVAEKTGVRPGILKARLDKERLANELMLLEPEIAWVGIRVEGTLLVIEVVEKNRPPADSARPAHIVAAKDGLVTDLLVVTGEPKVRPGETVRSGQLLIEGVLLPGEMSPAVPSPVRARGEVWARVWYAGYGEAAMQESVKTKTGRRSVLWSLVVDGKRVLQIGREQVRFSDFAVETRKQRLPERIVRFPVEIITIQRYELLSEKRVLTYEQALELAAERARAEAVRQLPAGLESKSVGLREVTTENTSLVRVRYVLETLENIAAVKETAGGD